MVPVKPALHVQFWRSAIELTGHTATSHEPCHVRVVLDQPNVLLGLNERSQSQLGAVLECSGHTPSVQLPEYALPVHVGQPLYLYLHAH